MFKQTDQPDDTDKEKCVMTDDNGYWNDVPCTDKANVICEYKPTGMLIHLIVSVIMSPPIYNGGDILVYQELSVCPSVCHTFVSALKQF